MVKLEIDKIKTNIIDKIKKKENHINILAYIIIFLTFMGSNFAKFNIIGINFNLARIAMLVPVILVFLDIFKNKKLEIYTENKSLKKIVIFFIIISIYSILSIYKTKDIKHYFIENFFICIGTINIVFFINNVDIKNQMIRTFNIISITIVVNCLYYLFLYYIQNNNVGGFYHNSNDLATALLLAIPISAYLIKTGKERKYKIFQSIVLTIEIISFMNITSRACILGMSLLIFSFIILNIIKNKKKILNNKKLKIFVSILLVFSIIMVIIVATKYIGKLSIHPIKNAISSNQIRINLIFNGIHFLGQEFNWLMGIGAGNAEYYLKNYSIYSLHDIYSFHNPLLEIGVTYGIVILLWFLLTYTKIISNLINICKKEKNAFTETTIMLCFLIAMIIAGISSSSIITREWIWILIAIIISYINTKQKDKMKEGK